MPDHESRPPPDAGGAGSEAEEAAWEMATAETLRARGELAEAATWYRRAANHLMEAGDDERAISVAKLAAELAALDDAGRPSTARQSIAADTEMRTDRPADPRPKVAEPKVSSAPDAGAERLPWSKAERTPAVAPPSKAVSAAPLPRPAVSSAPGKSPASLAPVQHAAGASAAPGRNASSAALPAQSGAGGSKPAASTPISVPRPGPPRPSAAAALRPSAHAARAESSQPDARSAARTDDEAPSGGVGNGVSPIAAMVDEAVSRIDEVPQTPLSGSGEARTSRNPGSYSPARAVESEEIAARLAALPLFSDFPPEALREISREAGIVRYRAGEFLCESGAPEGPMFVLIEGAAWVGLAGSDSPAAIVSAGDFVGEISAMFGGARTASVLAQGNIEAVALAPSFVRGLAQEFAPFRDAIESSVRERLMESLPHIVPMLRGFADGDRRALMREFEIVSIAEGGVILTEGEMAVGLCIIAAGEAEVYGGTMGSTRALRARLGDALGIGSVFTGEPAGASARAARRMLIARLPRTRAIELTLSFPTLRDTVNDIGAPGRGIVV